MPSAPRSRIYETILPPTGETMCIGLYGGSFNPAHEGHRHVAQTALKRLELDQVWCMVTPGNPLKDNDTLPSQQRRMAQTAQVMDHPAIKVTGFEATIGTRYSAQTIRYLQARRPQIRFVWLMGADNLHLFHHWRHWQDIFLQIPIAIIDRPSYSLSPLYAKAAQHFAPWRIAEAKARHLPRTKSPAWTFLYGPRSSLSSTSLRNAAKSDHE